MDVIYNDSDGNDINIENSNNSEMICDPKPSVYISYYNSLFYTAQTKLLPKLIN